MSQQLEITAPEVPAPPSPVEQAADEQMAGLVAAGSALADQVFDLMAARERAENHGRLLPEGAPRPARVRRTLASWQDALRAQHEQIASDLEPWISAGRALFVYRVEAEHTSLPARHPLCLMDVEVTTPDLLDTETPGAVEALLRQALAHRNDTEGGRWVDGEMVLDDLADLRVRYVSLERVVRRGVPWAVALQERLPVPVPTAVGAALAVSFVLAAATGVL